MACGTAPVKAGWLWARLATTRSMASRNRSSTDAPAPAFSWAKRTRSGLDRAKRSDASITTPSGWRFMRPMVGGGGDRRLSPGPPRDQAHYLVSERMGAAPRLALLGDGGRGAYVVENLLPDDYVRVRQLMDSHADQDLGL